MKLASGYPVMKNHSFGIFTFISTDSPFLESYKDKCTFDEWTRLPNQPSAFRIFTIISVLTILVILVVIGNSLVIAAVLMRRRLRSATGLLILSLAVADLLVGLLILPFSIANEVLNSFWIFGDYWCTAWLTIDIWMCTSSIYNLVAISIDRYIAIIKPLNYPMLITKFRARCIVAIVWIVSFIICSPSFLLASSEKKKQTEAFDPNECRCTPSNSGMAYILFSACSSFYIPMIIVVCVYVKIYLAASAATKSVYSGMMQVTTTAIANKTPKNVLMQNPSALSRAINIPCSKSEESNSKRNQEEETKMSTNICEITKLNRRINGSCSNLNKRRNSSLRTNFVKKLQHAATVADFKLPFRVGEVRHSKDLASHSEENVKNAGDGKDVPLKVIDAPIIKLEDCTGGVGSSTSSFEMDANTKLNEELYCAKDRLYETETLLASNNSYNAEIKDADNSSSLEPKETNDLHQNSTRKKKKGSFKMFLARLIGRTPRKRTGCVYEKRLSLEIKAAKTVAIVTGCFIFCWLGFAILYGISFYVAPNDILWSIVFWLGYLNSALNPIIYTVFNREFRTCFKKLLTCNHSLFKTDQFESASHYQRPRQPMAATHATDGYHSISATPRPSQRISLPTPFNQ